MVWVAFSFSTASSQPRSRTGISCNSCLHRWILLPLSHMRRGSFESHKWLYGKMKVRTSIYLAPFLYYKFPSRNLSNSNQAVYNCHGLKINIHLAFFKVAINIGHFLLCLHDMQIYAAMSVDMNLKTLQETGEDRKGRCAAIHGVPNSRTRLNNCITTTVLISAKISFIYSLTIVLHSTAKHRKALT